MRLPRKRVRVMLLYLLAIAGEFRWTLAGVVLLVAGGAALFAMTPAPDFGGARPGLGRAAYAAWMALFGEPILGAPGTWYVALVQGAYPLFGVVLVGEGVVRFALLTLSRQRGEKEWMRVIASTYSDHVVLCGLGHLGYRVLEQLLALGADVVSVERDATCRFLSLAKATGAPVLVRDMRDDEVLEEAGVARARTIVLATNDDMANLEAALDARRFNPRIRVVMRLFDQQLAAKVAGAFNLGAVFSASALAAPAVAVMAQASRVLASYSVAGAAHVVGELKVEERSSLVGRSTAELEQAHQARVVARNGASATDAPVAGGDVLVVHAAAAAWPALAEAARAS